MPSLQTWLVWLLLSASSMSDRQSEPEATKVAETYLTGVTGAGDEHARELLLGGATTDAQIFTLENWRIVSKDPFKSEEGDLGRAVADVRAG